ncbi:MAG: hypothetical protein AAFQ81_06190 [Pseudomonadota bacterium]
MRPWRIASRRRLGRGFGLPEALVAMLIAALITAAFYDSVSTGSLLRRNTDTRAALALEAYLLLDTVGDTLPIRSGFDRRGERDGLSWRILITETPPEGSAATALDDRTLLHIYIAVAPADGRAPPFELHAARYRESPI